jgi:hypothetical protein
MFCTQCGAKNDGAHRFCVTCGAPLPALPSAEPSPAATPSPASGPPPTIEAQPTAASRAVTEPAATPAPARTLSRTTIGVVGAVVVVLGVVGLLAALGSKTRSTSSTPSPVTSRPTEGPATTPEPQPASPAPSSAPTPAARPGMIAYPDPRGLFTIEYPVGWRVRAPGPDGVVTTFYLDDPDDGIAVTVLAQATAQGSVNTSALASLLVEQLRRSSPDFQLTVLAAHPQSSGGEIGEVSAGWTSRKAQRMRAKGVIATVPRSGATAYSYVVGQASEFVFPGIEPLLQRVLESFRPSTRG